MCQSSNEDYSWFPFEIEEINRDDSMQLYLYIFQKKCYYKNSEGIQVAYYHYPYYSCLSTLLACMVISYRTAKLKSASIFQFCTVDLGPNCQFNSCQYFQVCSSWCLQPNIYLYSATQLATHSLLRLFYWRQGIKYTVTKKMMDPCLRASNINCIINL